MRFTYFLTVFFLSNFSSSSPRGGGHHGGGGHRGGHRPPHHTHAPVPPPTSGLGVSNIFHILLLAYLASLAVSIHLLTTNVNITSLGRNLEMSSYYQDQEEQDEILTRLNFD